MGGDFKNRGIGLTFFRGKKIKTAGVLMVNEPLGGDSGIRGI